MGRRLISFKAETWRGKSLLNVSDRGQRRLLKLENAYVSSDGSEIRAFPGFACIWDGSEENNPNGYTKDVLDAYRPILDPDQTTNDLWVFSNPFSPSSTQTLYSRAKPAHYHGFEQVQDEVVIWGETRFRESLITEGPTKERATVTAVSSSTYGAQQRWAIATDQDETALARTLTDAAGPGINGLAAGNVVYIEGITVADTAIQALLDAQVNGRMHEVKALVAGGIHLHTQASVAVASEAATAGDISVIRSNFSGSYPTPFGEARGPYAASPEHRPDDKDALTAWRISAPLDLLAPEKPCSVSWVANRTRDFGDQPGGIVEGWQHVSNTGVSRREQRKLPYRTNPAVATNRIILAAPGYGCMFQIPMDIPVDTDAFPSPGFESETGIVWPGNSLYDMPRSLGVPKPRLVDSDLQEAQPSPQDWESGTYDTSLIALGSSADTPYGMPPGTYKFAVSFEDEGTGQEGPISEEIEVTVPEDQDYPYGIRIRYVHPGYVMGECLALKMNIYMSRAGEDALEYYTSVALRKDIGASFGGIGKIDNLTSNYGFPVSPEFSSEFGDGPSKTVRSFSLPLLNTPGDVDDLLIPSRVPLAANMPRGAEAACYVRGVLISGGAMGNAGPAGQLWRARASVHVDTAFSNILPGNRIIVRVFSDADDLGPTSTAIDGDLETSMLGIAGRCFPDAYQGIPIVSQHLFHTTKSRQIIDKVMNRSVWRDMRETPFLYEYEQLQLAENVFSASRFPGLSPSGTDLVAVSDQEVFFVMPRGQIQISDPGAPWLASKAAIEVIDPSRGDDVVAIGQIGGSGVICSRKETYALSWNRTPIGEVASLVSNEHGCVGQNTMVEFDGGLAWISERGPVALIGGAPQFIGIDLAEEFYGFQRRYQADSRGMMRHAWGCHDQSRGLVMWGLRVSSPSSIEDEGQNKNFVGDDGIASRFPCDEVLIWSYRANAFSTWRPPAGLEIYWMRPLRDVDGNVRVCFLAADGRIYALDDRFNNSLADFNGANVVTPTANGSGTTFSFSGSVTLTDGNYDGAPSKNLGFYLRPGQLVEFLDENGRMTHQTTIASVTTVSGIAATSTIELTAGTTWKSTWTVRIGSKPPITLVTSYMDGGEMHAMNIEAVQMRYSLFGAGTANIDIKARKFDISRDDDAEEIENREIQITNQDGGGWPNLGRGVEFPSTTFGQLGQRRSWRAGISGSEIALEIQITGAAQVRIQDIALEVG